MEDVNIIFKPTIDDKEIKQEMQQIAKTSKTAIEQSFKSLDLTMRKSTEAWNKELENVKKQNSNIGDDIIGRPVAIDEFLEDFEIKVRRLYDEIRKTGNLPLGMSEKTLSSIQAVQNLIHQYEELERYTQSSSRYTSEETEAFNELTLAMRNTAQSASQAELDIQRLEQQQELLTERTKLLGQVQQKVGSKVYKGQELLDYYDKYKAKLEAAQEAADKLTISKQLIDDGKEVKEVTQILQELSPGKFRIIDEGDAGFKDMLEQAEELRAKVDKATKSMEKFADVSAKLEKIRSLGISDTYTAEGGQDKLTENIKQRKKELEKLNGEYKNLQASQDKLKATGGQYVISQEYETATARMKELEVEIVKAASRMNELSNNAHKIGMSFAQWRNVIWSASRVLGNVYTLGLDIVRGAKMIANFYKKIWGYVKKVLGVFKQLRENVKKTGDEHKESWAKMLKDIIRYSLGIRSLFMLFRRLRGYIKEAFKAMAEQIPEVNQTLSELKSSFNMLKGSLATAFEPLISALAPALLRLINLFATLLTYVGMFFAAITGRGYVYKANKSMTSFADAAGGAADNVKELNKQLQGFDELNNLTTNENKDNGGAGAGPLANFEKVPVLDWIKDLADKIREIFERIMEPIKRAWAKVGDYVVAAWKRAFMSVRDLLLDIGRDFLRAWDKMGESIATNFLLIVGDVGNIIANIADSLREAWNYNENGYKIWMAILTIIDKVLAGIRRITKDMRDWSAQLNVTPAMTSFREWLESCEPVVESLMGVLFDFWNDALKPILTWAFDGENSGVARFFKIFKDFNEKVDWEKLRGNLDKIWGALGRFGQTVGDGLLLFLERLSDRLADWVNSDDFDATIDKIVTFLDDIEPEDVADDLDMILTDIGNIFSQLSLVFDYIIEHKDDIMNFLEWVTEHLDMLAKIAVFGKLIIDISRFAINLALLDGSIGKVSASLGELDLAGKVSTLATKLGLLSPEVLIIVGAIALLTLAFIHLYKTSDTFKEKVQTSIQEVKDAFNKFKEELQPALDSIKEAFTQIKEQLQPVIDLIWKFIEAFFSGILSALGPLVSTIGDSINFIVSLVVAFFSLMTGDVDGFLSNIKNAIGFFFDGLKNLWLTITSWFKGVLATFGIDVDAKFIEIKDNILMVFEQLKEGLKPIINGILAFIESMVNGIISGLNLAIGALNNLQFDVPNWVPKVGGNHFGLNIPTLGEVSLPRLAQGAVIPPNNEFLAVLGDQKRGTNIESPLSTMVEAFNMANKGGSEQEIALLQEQNDLLRQLLQKEFGISNEAIFKSVRQSNSQYRKQTGTSAFA